MRFFSTILLLLLFGTLFGQEWKSMADSAIVYKDKQQPDKVISFYSLAIEKLPRDSFTSVTHIGFKKAIGDVYYSRTQLPEAAKAYQQCRQLTEQLKGKNNGEYAFYCLLSGVCNHSLGNMDTAKSLYEEAKAIRLQLFGPESPAYAQSCNNLGALFMDQGYFDQAEPLILQAKMIREKIPPVKQSPVYAITCTGLANLYRDMGQFDKAESLYLEANAIRAQLAPVNEHRDYASGCNILADLYYYKQQYQQAESLYLRAMNIRAKIDKRGYDYGQSCNNLATLYRDMGQLEKATSFALEARKIYDSTLDVTHPSRVININNLGELYYALKKYSESRDYLLLARQVWLAEKGEDHPFSIANADELTKAYWQLKESEKANELISQVSISKYKRLDRIFQFTSEAEKALYLKNINGSNDEYHSFYFKEYDRTKAGTPYTISLLNRNLILSSVQQTRQLIYQSGSKSLIEKYNYWITLKQGLANLYAADQVNYADKIRTMEYRADSLERELSRNSLAFYRQQSGTTWEAVQQSLKPGEAAIEFVQFNYFDGHQFTDSSYYVAIVLTHAAKEPVLVQLTNEKNLDRFFQKKAASPSSTINLFYATDSLYQFVWKPIQPYLKDIKQVYFAPTGLLHRISFAALKVDGKKYLRDEYKLTQLLTTASLIENKQVSLSVGDRIALYGDVQYSNDSLNRFAAWQPLPGTKNEIQRIEQDAFAHHIRTASYSGWNATEESVKSLSGDTTLSVLHIATHGFFYPDPATTNRYSKERGGRVFKRSDNPLFRGGLVMAGGEDAWKGMASGGKDDGILTAYEVSNLYLPKAKMVVLSACQTGIGEIQGSEGVYGLQRSFKIAGVKYLVMSLWTVPDAESGEFMQLFYEQLFQQQPIDLAFSHAQRQMAVKYANDPYKWAAWMMIK